MAFGPYEVGWSVMLIGRKPKVKVKVTCQVKSLLLQKPLGFLQMGNHILGAIFALAT